MVSWTNNQRWAHVSHQPMRDKHMKPRTNENPPHKLSPFHGICTHIIDNMSLHSSHSTNSAHSSLHSSPEHVTYLNIPRIPYILHYTHSSQEQNVLIQKCLLVHQGWYSIPPLHFPPLRRKLHQQFSIKMSLTSRVSQTIVDLNSSMNSFVRTMINRNPMKFSHWSKVHPLTSDP